MSGKKNILKAVVFLAGLAVLFSLVQKLFRVGNPDTRRIYTNLYNEEKGKLDAVYIGASNVYAFWQGTPAWDEYGISVISCSNPAQPAQAIKYYMKEVQRIQPQALCIVNLNCLAKTSMTSFQLHTSLDYLPWSLNKVAMVQDLSRQMGNSFLESLEYYFPVIRFHSRWNELTESDFFPDNQDVKGGVNYERILTVTKNVSKKYTVTQKERKLPDKANEILMDLLDFCEAEQVRVLFVMAPQARDKKIASRYNYVARVVQERGFDMLNLMGSTEEIGLDLATDYFNERHTNIHGSLKYTSYLGGYLQKTYGFADKRGEASYQDWDKASELYQQMLSAYTLDLERNHEPRDASLEAPGELAAAADGTTVQVSWKETEGADGYLIYRRHRMEAWECCGETGAGTTGWTDTDCLEADTYTYTVVPFRTEGENRIYGKFAYYGTEVTTSQVS